MEASQEAWLLLRAFLALAAVLLLAVVSLRFGLPWLARQRASNPERQIHIEDVCLLDRNHRLYVVRWKDEVLLLATSQDRIDLVARGAEAQAVPAPRDSLPSRGEG
jgi:flagellar biogenesis protein FliO